jgi:hypothetical protein
MQEHRERERGRGVPAAPHGRMSWVPRSRCLFFCFDSFYSLIITVIPKIIYSTF